MKITTEPYELPEVNVVLTPKEAFILRILMGNMRTTDATASYNQHAGFQDPYLYKVLGIADIDVALTISDLFAGLFDTTDSWSKGLR